VKVFGGSLGRGVAAGVEMASCAAKLARVCVNREYAAVFAHPDDPCAADNSTASYLQCMSRELEFVGQHLNAFIEDLRRVSGSPEELAALNKINTDWRAYRESLCSLPYKRFSGGTIKGPMSADCQLRLNRSYMKSAERVLHSVAVSKVVFLHVHRLSFPQSLVIGKFGSHLM
jgi:uncharacterized protein YecT (DUF1311 family)